MIVILPSEERVPVPDGIRTIGQLHQFLFETAGFPTSILRLFNKSDEVTTDSELAAAGDDAVIDLALQVGDGFTICRSATRDVLDSQQSETFVPHRSLKKARRLDHFVGPPGIRLGSEQDENKEHASRFRVPFEEHRRKRVRVLREKRAQLDSGPIVVSTFNWGFRQMFENWAASCDHHKIDSRNFTLLFPTDERADALARDLGFVTYFDGNSYGDLPTEAAGAFGDRIFGQMLFAKIAMTMDMLDVGGDFLRQDVDLIWAKDPRGDLATRMDRQSLDMQFMYDGPSAIHQPLHYNSGFIFIRSNSFSRHMWKTVFDNYGQILAERAEQRVINVVAHCLRERGLRMERLPELRYINGHVISRLLRNKAELPKEWSVVHASWTSDIDRKIVNMKKFGLWYLD